MKNTDLTEKQLFALLRSGLWQTTIPETLFTGNQCNWPAVIALAKGQTVSALAIDGIQTLPESLLPERTILLRLGMELSGTIKAHKLLNTALVRTVGALEAEGIPSVLLKGQAYARYYPKPEHRMCGDIDLYVGDKNYEAARTVLRAFAEEGEAGEKHAHFELYGCVIELHRYAQMEYGTRNLPFRKWADSYLHDSRRLRSYTCDGQKINIPAANFDAIFILHHFVRHFITGGIGLRQIADWTMCLDRSAGELDMHLLQKELKDLHLMRAWQVFGYIAVRQLGLPEHKMPFYSARYAGKAEKALSIIMRQGNFGRMVRQTTPEHQPVILRKIRSCIRILKQQAGIVSILPGEILSYLPHYLATGIRNINNG